MKKFTFNELQQSSINSLRKLFEELSFKELEEIIKEHVKCYTVTETWTNNVSQILKEKGSTMYVEYSSLRNQSVHYYNTNKRN